MNHHTFLCGSSKTKERDAYYIKKSQWFWGLLHQVGITDRQLTPAEYRRLGREYGIYLTEIVDPDHYRIGEDSEIEAHHVADGMERLIERIEAHDPNRIGLKGKNTATWFYRYCEGKEITDSSDPDHKSDRRALDYGALDWDYYGRDYYLVTSLRAYHWDEDVWREFWEACQGDVDAFRGA